MAKNEPQIYRKGSARRIALRVILWVLAVFLFLCITAFFGFRKYIAYTGTGKLYLDIPWLEGYVSGPPESDDLAEYLSPVQSDASDSQASSDSTAPDDASEPKSGDISSDAPSNTPGENAQDNVDTFSDSADAASASTDTAADGTSAQGSDAPTDVPVSPAE